MVTTRVLLSCLILCFTTFTTNAEKLKIAVSANFATPVAELVKEFKKKHPFTEQISVASTGVLYQQIRHGAPFDIFLAADLRRPQLLEEQGLIHEKYRKTYAIGQLALWSATSDKNISLDDLKNYDGRIAAAGPHIAPYGLAAKETLISLNLWSKYHQKLIVGNNINQTYQQILSGAVSYGFISYSQLLNSKVGHGVLIDNSLHHELEQQMVVLKHAENISLATQFFEFLLTNSAQKIITKTGYLPAITIPDQQEPKPQEPKPSDELNDTEIAVVSI
ncbi:molybdate ABC transporter substrate-binding protein [Thalassotalea fonticola]|uniref:Molybdate ABC transporter substrate-binding protein n=1 Tax=Thalassotalea fonticola TaxID=3065649 RepID=A0ABZ0GPF5_9GAMM|nr:molybdate ABC transporter substrate-binding protein [Colwelliaceae bacterium S1-1]